MAVVETVSLKPLGVRWSVTAEDGRVYEWTYDPCASWEGRHPADPNWRDAVPHQRSLAIAAFRDLGLEVE